jgi:hypothetical protein
LKIALAISRTFFAYQKGRLLDHLCNCLAAQYLPLPWSELTPHRDVQDTSCEGWKLLLDLVEAAAKDNREIFAPRREIPDKLWGDVVTLPPSIAKLTSVKHLMLYGSNLVRIPPEIAGMTALEEFTPYPSPRLHYFPYEITRCPSLKRSTVSTRQLYGNLSYRPPFPRLPWELPVDTRERCSVCDGPFSSAGPLPRWLSLRVATDVLPLIVYACSESCILRLPEGARGYVAKPHWGGLALEQAPKLLK